MGANGTNMAFLIVFTLTGRRGRFPARGGSSQRAVRCPTADAPQQHNGRKRTPPAIGFQPIFDGFRAKTTRPATCNSRPAKLVSDKDGCGHAKGR